MYCGRFTLVVTGAGSFSCSQTARNQTLFMDLAGSLVSPDLQSFRCHNDLTPCRFQSHYSFIARYEVHLVVLQMTVDFQSDRLVLCPKSIKFRLFSF
jgi:hypothetical protein